MLRQYLYKAPEYEVEAAGEEVLRVLHQELEKHDTSCRDLRELNGWIGSAVTRREFQLLTAIAQLDDDATCLNILRRVKSWSPRLNLGHIYYGLDRLEDEGYVKVLKPAPAEGDRPRPKYRLLPAGKTVLARANAEGQSLQDPLEDVVPGGCTETPR
jgi:DNA-binding PadR family transcriptional regulator